MGEGSNGVVHEGYDPALGRRVAIKQLRTSRDPDRLRVRLRQEARALARVSHPNVVQLFDVGQADDHVFLAMEYIEGETLAHWLSTPRTTDEIVTAFLAAGEGLAAAHAADLVHRDFKPDNVLVGKARVVVVDFGVAYALRPNSTSGDSLETRREQDHTGWVGTPAYMAPEQFLRADTTARTDQFSFCVALWEALFGASPFEGDGLHALMDAVIHGRRRSLPRRRGVSRRICRALDRGLQTDPARRFGSMHELLAQLGGSSATRWWGTALGAALATGVTVAAASQGRLDACPSAASLRADLWDEARADELRTSLAATPSREVTEPLLAGFERYATGWSNAAHQACEAQRPATHDPQSPVYDRACLEARRVEFDLLSQAYLGGSATLLALGTGPIDALPLLTDCIARDGAPPPDVLDPAEAAAAARIRESLARGRTLLTSGEVDEALEVLTEARRSAHALDNRPLQLEASLSYVGALEVLGRTDEALELSVQTFHAASSHAAWSVATEAARVTLEMHTEFTNDKEQADHWLRVMNAALGRQQDPPVQQRFSARIAASNFLRQTDRLDQAAAALAELEALPPGTLSEGQRAELEYHAATLASEDARDDEALRRMLEALRLAESAHGRASQLYALIQNNLGATYYRRGDYDAALAAFERSYEARRLFEATPSSTAIGTLSNIAAIHGTQGKHEDAARELEDVSAYYREHEISPAAHAVVQLNLGHNYLRLGRADDAVTSLTTAVELHNTAMGAEHPRTLRARIALGDALVQSGRVEEGVRIAAEATQTCRAVQGPNGKDAARMAHRLGSIYLGLERWDDAETSLREAMHASEAALVASHPRRARVARALAKALRARGKAAEAVQVLARALELGEGLPATSRTKLETALAEARDDWRFRRDR